MTTHEIIERAIVVHGNKFSYEKVNYMGDRVKIKIICPTHGVFQQLPRNHISLKQGCPSCYGNKKINVLEFIEKAQNIHGHFYNYELSKIVGNNKQKIEIICPNHGVFKQSPNSHLRGYGCIKCRDLKVGERFKYSQEEWINNAISVHGNNYDYSLVEYKGIFQKVKIICPIHGIFLQRPVDHSTKKHGCKSCNRSKGEVRISQFLDNKGIEYYEQHKFLDCKNLSQLKFDFYLPNYNCCIEYDGEQHFVSKNYFGGDRAYNTVKICDDIKNKYTVANGINLLRIPYTDYDKIEEILNNKFIKQNT